MINRIGILFLLVFILPISVEASFTSRGGEGLKTLDSLRQYDYAYANLTPFNRKDKRTFTRENRDFFLEEITYPFSTPFTPEWNGNFRKKYILDKADLYNYFKGNEAYDLVLIKGPNLMHDFSFEVIVYRKIKGRYLVVRSFIERERFVEKSYRVIGQEEFDALSASLGKLSKLTEEQTGDYYYTDPKVLEDCLGKSLKEEVDPDVAFNCKVELTSGVVIDNTQEQYFFLYGYDGMYDAVHPRKLLYDRMRQEEVEEPFFREVRWQITYVEGEGVAEAY